MLGRAKWERCRAGGPHAGANLFQRSITGSSSWQPDVQADWLWATLGADGCLKASNNTHEMYETQLTNVTDSLRDKFSYYRHHHVNRALVKAAGKLGVFYHRSKGKQAFLMIACRECECHTPQLWLYPSQFHYVEAELSCADYHGDGYETTFALLEDLLLVPTVDPTIPEQKCPHREAVAGPLVNARGAATGGGAALVALGDTLRGGAARARDRESWEWWSGSEHGAQGGQWWWQEGWRWNERSGSWGASRAPATCRQPEEPARADVPARGDSASAALQLPGPRASAPEGYHRRWRRSGNGKVEDLEAHDDASEVVLMDGNGRDGRRALGEDGRAGRRALGEDGSTAACVGGGEPAMGNGDDAWTTPWHEAHAQRQDGGGAANGDDQNGDNEWWHGNGAARDTRYVHFAPRHPHGPRLGWQV